MRSECVLWAADGMHSSFCDRTTTIPSGPRQKWLKKLRHHKVKLCVSAHFGGPASESSKKLRPFVAVPRRRDSVDSDTEEGRAHAGLKTPHMALSGKALHNFVPMIA